MQSRYEEWLRVPVAEVQSRDVETDSRWPRETDERVSALAREMQRVLAQGADLLAVLRKQAETSTEKRLSDAPAERLQQLEVRLEHEWTALRQLHEVSLRALEQHATAAQEQLARAEARIDALGRELLALASENTRHIRESADAVRQKSELETAARPMRRLLIPALVTVILGLAAYDIYSQRRLSEAARRATAMASAAEGRAAEAQRLAGQAESSQVSAQRGAASALAAATRAERIAHILAAADLRRYVLLGQKTTPTAAGQAMWSRSMGLVLTAAQLPAAPTSHVYQAWVVTTRGTLSVGFLSADDQGRVSAAFDTPPELPGAVAGFMLTLEPAGGRAEPSGPVVLAS